MGIIAKTCGNTVATMRKARGWSQENLAEYSHISLRQIAAIENGKSFLTERTAEKIAKALGVHPLRLFEAPQFSQEPTIAQALSKIAGEFGFDLKTRRKPRAKPNTPPAS